MTAKSILSSKGYCVVSFIVTSCPVFTFISTADGAYSKAAAPYLGAVKNTDPVYINTRKLILSSYNPFFLKAMQAKESSAVCWARYDLAYRYYYAWLNKQ